MNEKVWMWGLACKATALFLAVFAYVLFFFFPPFNSAPYSPWGNVGFFVCGMAIVLLCVGLAIEGVAYHAVLRKLDLMLVPESLEINKNTIILASILAIVLSSLVLTFFRILPAEDFMKIVMFILGALFGGGIAYVITKEH